MKQAISVTQLNRFIKDMFTQNQLLYNVMVKGEISNFKESHGNYYFSLKDESSSISAIIFSNAAYNCRVDKISDGMKVIVTGRIAAYEKTGTYAIYVSKLEDAGLGDYFIKLNELKEKLKKEGLFDEKHKKEINKYSMNVGVVTAQNGAAIRDIIKTLKNKNPYVRIVFYPSKVQGDDAYKSIVDGIEILDKENLDVIIVGRGGGSIEDLYVFNDERVARAIYDAKTPIISAVGHEINESISDFVADLKVATPTAAGEAATFSYDEFVEDIDDYKETLSDLLLRNLTNVKEKIDNKKIQLELLSPKQKIKSYKENIGHKQEKIKSIIKVKVLDTKSKLREYLEMLKGRDALSKLESGFAYITDAKGKKIVSVKEVKKDSHVLLTMKDGKIDAKVEKVFRKG